MEIIKGGNEYCPRAEIWTKQCLYGIMEAEEMEDHGDDIKEAFYAGHGIVLELVPNLPGRINDWFLKPYDTESYSDCIEIWSIGHHGNWLLAIVDIDAFEEDDDVYKLLLSGIPVAVELNTEIDWRSV